MHFVWYLVLSFAWISVFPSVLKIIIVHFIKDKGNFLYFLYQLLEVQCSSLWIWSILELIFWILADGRKCCCCFFRFLIHHPCKTFFAHFLKINLQVPRRMTLLAPFVWLVRPSRFLLFLVSTGISPKLLSTDEPDHKKSQADFVLLIEIGPKWWL